MFFDPWAKVQWGSCYKAFGSDCLLRYNLSATLRESTLEEELQTKVLVYEPDEGQRHVLRENLEAQGLLGLRVDVLSRFLRFLESKVDLGGLFLATVSGQEEELLETLKAIRFDRPELPVFVRVNLEQNSAIAGLESLCCGIYVSAADKGFASLVQTRVFSRVYPLDLVRTVQKETQSVLGSVFPNLSIEVDTPFISHDKILFGEILSFVRIEGGWCRGYMVLEAREEALWRLMQSGALPGATVGRSTDADFRRANSLLTEILNLSWGRLKGWFDNQDRPAEPERFRSELPCIINNGRRYMTFGSDAAKLCFTYVCLDPKMRVEPLVLQQRLIFHLKWRPEEREQDDQVDALINDGEVVFL